MIELWAVGVILICSVIGAFGSLCFKFGADVLDWKTIYKNYYLILGVFLYGISAILYSIALKGGDLSIVYPLVAVSYIWITILSKYLLRENIGKFKWLGILAIIIGITFLGMGI